MSEILWLVIVASSVAAFIVGHFRAKQLTIQQENGLHSRPIYHGGFLVIFVTIPSLLLLLLWYFIAPNLIEDRVIRANSEYLNVSDATEVLVFIRDVKAIATGGIVSASDNIKVDAATMYQELQTSSSTILFIAVIILMIIGFIYGFKQLTPQKRTRIFVERTILVFLGFCSTVAILTTIGIVVSLVFESILFFQKVPIWDFVFGTHWSPQSAFEGVADDGAETNTKVFGAIPLLTGTLLVTVIAIFVAAPIGLLSAIYLSDYASHSVRAFSKPFLEILAGVPTVVYGFFAALTMAPFFRNVGESIGLTVSSESALAAGVVMGIMIIPFVSSLSDDVINAVPQSLRDGSAGLGATKSETMRKVVLPAALPGIVSALILAISRAVGETMIVVMAAGLAANLTFNPLEATTTVTVQIVTLLVGDQEFDSAKTLAAFALGLLLFCITLALNIYALRVVRKYREQYE